MEENQKLGPSEVKCWQCGTAVYKGTKECPKCGAPSPTADIAKIRKITPIFLRVVMPVSIVLLIAGFIMLVKGALNIFYGGYYLLTLSCFVIIIGVIGVMIGPILRSFLAKVDKATEKKQ